MIAIGNFSIGLDQRPFIIAEMSGNHNHSLDRALEIVNAAAKAGAHTLKPWTWTSYAVRAAQAGWSCSLRSTTAP